jgi:hypothetical protein
VFNAGPGTRFSRLGESLTKLGKIIGNLNNFWGIFDKVGENYRKFKQLLGKSLMKWGEFTINLAKIRNKLGESFEPWFNVLKLVDLS